MGTECLPVVVGHVPLSPQRFRGVFSKWSDGQVPAGKDTGQAARACEVEATVSLVRQTASQSPGPRLVAAAVRALWGDGAGGESPVRPSAGLSALVLKSCSLVSVPQVCSRERGLSCSAPRTLSSRPQGVPGLPCCPHA